MLRNIGEMKHRITIQLNKPNGESDAKGYPKENWVDIYSIWAHREDISGKEFFGASAENMEEKSLSQFIGKKGLIIPCGSFTKVMFLRLSILAVVVTWVIFLIFAQNAYKKKLPNLIRRRIAMAKLNFEVVGVHAVETGLENLSKKEQALEAPALQSGAEPVYQAILNKAPERTGKGKSAIKIGKVRTHKGVRYISIGVHKEDHAKGLHMYYQEFGTSRHKAQPHIRPGYEEKKAEAFGMIKDILKAGLGL